MVKFVAFVEFFPPYMGSDKRIFEIITRLSEPERHIIIFPALRLLIKKLDIEKYQEYSKKYIFPKEDKMLHTHRIILPSFISKLWSKSMILGYLLSFPFIIFSALKLLIYIKPDVVILNYPSPYTGLIGFIVSKVLRIRVILDFNDLIAQYTLKLFNLRTSSFIGRMLILIQNIIAKYSHLIFAVSSYIVHYCIRIGIPPKKVVLLPNGVDLKLFFTTSTAFEKLVNKKEVTCAYAGSLESWAGTNVIFELAKLDKSISYIIAGDVSNIKKSQVPDNIHLFGYLSPDKIPSFLALADFVLVPFPLNEVSHAASPLKLFEALACNKPVIVSNLVGVRDVVVHKKTAILVDSEKPSEWLKAIHLLMNNKKLVITIKKNIWKIIKKYDWNYIAKSFYEAILRSIMK